MTRGTVKSYDPDEGIGYIAPDDDDEKVPFDRKSLKDYPKAEDPEPGDRVSFVIQGGMAGLWAVNIRRLP